MHKQQRMANTGRRVGTGNFPAGEMQLYYMDKHQNKKCDTLIVMEPDCGVVGNQKPYWPLMI